MIAEGILLSLAVTTSSVSLQYDELGRLLNETGGAGNTMTYAYDTSGRVKAVTDGVGNRTEITYDELGRRSTVKDPAGNFVSLSRNAGDDIIAVTDARGLQYTYQIDGLGQVWNSSGPDAGTEVYTNSNGLRTSRVTANGVTTNYSYDGLGRLTGVTAGNQAELFVYDTCLNGKGRQCQWESAGASTSYQYTPDGKVSSSLNTHFIEASPVVRQVAYGYDALGRLASVAYPDGNTVSYQYLDGRVQNVSLRFSGSTSVIPVMSNVTYAYGSRPAGWTLGNGLTKTLGYDLSGRIVAQALAAGAAVTQSLSLSYDSASRVAGITDNLTPSLSQTFGYDPLGRLTSTSRPGIQTNSTYDAGGNALSFTAPGETRTNVITPSSNKIASYASASYGPRSYGYDLLGRRVTESAAGDVRTYSYTPLGQLSSAVVNGTQSSYVTSQRGERLSKSSSLGNTFFTYVGQNQLAAERTGGVESDYIWIDGQVVGLARNGSLYYANSDHLNRPETLTNSSGSVVWKANTLAFGRTVAIDTVGGFNVGFPGQYFDSETGLWANGYRTYDASLGRYLEPDPIGLRGGLNNYAYAASNPISGIDPLGLSERDVGTILVRFKSTVSAMTRAGMRLEDVDLNNRRRFWRKKLGLETSLQDCGEQTDTMIGQMQQLQLDDSWSFYQDAAFGHAWGLAISDNLSDPWIYFDTRSENFSVGSRCSTCGGYGRFLGMPGGSIPDRGEK